MSKGGCNNNCITMSGVGILRPVSDMPPDYDDGGCIPMDISEEDNTFTPAPATNHNNNNFNNQPQTVQNRKIVYAKRGGRRGKGKGNPANQGFNNQPPQAPQAPFTEPTGPTTPMMFNNDTNQFEFRNGGNGEQKSLLDMWNPEN